MRSGGQESATPEAGIPEESVIVISDDENDVSLGLGNSVLLIEDEGEDSLLQEKKTLEVVDEELAITFSRKAHVMPHARYDCSTHPFNRMEQEIGVPLENNASYCDKCYCYLCDKPVPECSKWETPGYCHCNAHNKSKHWKGERDLALAGVLSMFNLDLTEIDTELKAGGNKLQLFLSELTPVYFTYLEGSMITPDSVERCVCSCHKGGTQNNHCNMCRQNHSLLRYYNYSEVHKTVTTFLDQVDEGSPKAAVVMLLGTAKELVYHKAPPTPFGAKDPIGQFKQSSNLLMTRIVTTLQRLLVMHNYPSILYDKFLSFFQCFMLPPHLYTFTSSLNILRWDNFLLTSVLTGQNVTGIRTNKGKKEQLWEAPTVVQSRVKRLEDDASYRPLVRYLNVVRTTDYNGLNVLKQKLCLYMCKYGDFMSATNCLLQTKGLIGGICQFFTPELFELHLTMLRTRSCPTENKLDRTSVWVPQSGGMLKNGVLLRTALRILLCNNHLYYEPSCWSALVKTFCMNEGLSKDGKRMLLNLYEPDKILQQTVITMSFTILDELQQRPSVHLPEPFHKSYTSSAELILIVQAVVRYLMAAHLPLRGMLELIAAFGPNHWALSLLIEGITPMPDLLFKFVCCVKKELHENEPRVLDLVKSRGSDYLSNLIPLFLLHPSDCVRSVAFHLLDFILHNLANLPSVGALGHCLKTKVVPHTYMISSTERKKLLTDINRLTTLS